MRMNLPRFGHLIIWHQIITIFSPNSTQKQQPQNERSEGQGAKPLPDPLHPHPAAIRTMAAIIVFQFLICSIIPFLLYGDLSTFHGVSSGNNI